MSAGQQHFEIDELEAVALGQTAPQLAAAVEEHARGCAECGRELAWLRAESALMRRRAASQTAKIDPAVWAAVESRVQAAKIVPLASRRRAPRTWLSAAAAVAAAAGLAVVFSDSRPAGRYAADAGLVAAAEPDDDAADPEVTAALDGAEQDYRRAVSELEAAAARSARRDLKAAPKLPPALQRARVQLADASSAAGTDVQARLLVLDGYATYLRQLQRAVDSEEALR